MTASMLNNRRKKLGMTIRALSRLSGIPVATVNRVLSKPSSVRFEHVDRVGRVLGVNFQGVQKISLHKVLHDRAYAKARFVAKTVQGSQGLEAAGVDSQGFNRIVDIAAQALLSGKKRKLWDED
ncbi:MAG: helix-turn-helix transcriptional regulator [Gemmataceae bacterium]